MNQLDPEVLKEINAGQVNLVNPLPTARTLSPADVAKGVEISKKTGVDALLAAKSLPQFQAELDQDYWNKLVQDHPPAAKFFAEPVNAAILQKDADSGALTAIAEAAKWLVSHPDSKNTLGGLLQGSLYRSNSAIYGGLRAGVEFVAPAMDPLAGTVLPENPLRRVAAGLGEQARLQSKAADLADPNAEGFWSQSVQSGGRSLVQNSKYMPLAFLGPVGGAAALTGMVAESFGQSYQDAREKGVTPFQSLQFASSQAAIEYATEKLPMQWLVGDIAKRTGFLKTLGKQAVAEIPGEQIATALQDMNEWAILHPEKTFKDYLEERPDAAAQTLVATLIGTGGNVTLVHTIDKLLDTEERRVMQAQQAEQSAQLLQSMQQTMAATDALKTNPETLQTFAQSLMEGGSDHVYIETQALVDAGIDAQELIDKLPSVAAQLDKLTEGGDIVVPVGELLTNSIGTTFAQTVIDHARTAPDAPSRVEAQEFMQSQGAKIQEEVKRVLEEKQADEAFQQERLTLQKELHDQLNTMGRWSTDVNEKYATLASNFYAVMSARANMPMRDFVNTYKLGFSNQTLAGAQYDQNGNLKTDTANFKNWFKESKAVDANGAPIMLFHGTNQSFDTFSAEQGGSNAGNKAGKNGLYFIDRPDIAERYATMKDGDANVMPVYLSLQNPARASFSNMMEADKFLASDYEGDGAIVEVTTPAGKKSTVYAVKDPNQIKSVFNNGEFSTTDNNILHQSATLRSGAETLAKYGLPLGGKYKTREVAAALEARQREIYGQIGPKDRSDEAVKKIASWMAEEVRFEMQHPRKSGVGWYSYKFQRALDTFAEVFPELKKDKNARDTMTALIAITSDGQKVLPNFRMAVDLYGNFRKTGKFSTERGHARMGSIQKNVDLLQKMLDEVGPKAMRKYLLQEATVSELRQRAQAEGVSFKTEYQADIKLPMAAVTFGPKLGAFYANLMGAHGYLTMDRWWSRTFNRYRGTLLQAPTKDGLARIKELMGHPEWSDDQAISATVEPRNSYEAKGFKDGTEIEKAANTVYKAAFENLEDAPFNSSDRTFMLRAVAEAQQQLAAEGRKISIADIQAVLWYYEKRLYGELGARQTADVSYEDAAKRIVSEHSAGRSRGQDASVAGEGPGVNDDGTAVGVSEEVDAVGLDDFDQGGAGGTFYQGDPAELVAQHNLTADNLLHAVKMGGIPVPSLAVTKKDHPLTGFGEITLLAPSEMVDPKGYAATKVFGADIYSPRYPKVSLQFTPNMQKRGESMLKAGMEATGTKYLDWSEVERDGARELERQPAVMWQFLTNQGIEPPVVRTQPKPLPVEMQGYANDKRAAYELESDPAFVEAAWEAYTNNLVKAYDGDLAAAQADVAQTRKNAQERGVSHLVRGYANDVVKFRRDSQDAGEVDRSATRYAMENMVRERGLSGELEAYAKSIVEDLNPNERIFQGFTNSGNRKYTPHTLENVVKILKKELRGGENFNYGVGSLRAKFTPQFKSIAQIRKEKGRLMDKAAFESVKKEIDDELMAISNEFGHRSLDTTISMIEDAAKMGVQKAAAYYDSSIEVSDTQARMVGEFLTRLRNLPTEYFEAKILRDVSLSEFKGAVVPEGVNPKVIEALNARGVTDIRTYKKGDDADRAAKIGEFGHLFFQQQRGSIAFANDITQQASIISMMSGADLSTFIHEGGHFFLEVQADLANKIAAKIRAGEQVSDGERSILDDMNRTLEWFGVKATPEMSALDHWGYMNTDEKREFHEKFARGFEAYAFEGKAPSMELQSVFQTFRAWLLNVYKAMLKSLNASKTDIGNALNVELTDEVRGVFDRMLATTEQIQEAEAARSMGPLFKTPEEGGMDLEAFTAYHNIGTQAAADAIDTLQAKGLRDMQWLSNAKSRKLKELQKQHAALRDQITIEVRNEVMAKPIYRAWTFLTARDGDLVAGEKRKGNTVGLNPEVDNLFTAIAKLGGLDRAAVKSAWGIDEKERLASGVFGSPVVRKTGGLSIDAMAERLVENGYMLPDENGKADVDKFEALFDDQRRGVDRYSIQRDMEAAYGEQETKPLDLQPMDRGKLLTEELRERYGTKDTAIWRRLSDLKMTSDEVGLPADVVAETFGFDSGDALVRALAEAAPPKEVIANMVDMRMLQEHADLATPEALEKSADAAIHNDVRARFVATELRALEHATSVRKKTPGQRASVDVLTQVAQEQAQAIIGKLKVREIRPAQYAAAAARSGRLAMKNLSDTEVAAQHKRNQLINTQAAKEAYKAVDEIRAADAFFKKIVTMPDKRAGQSRDMDVVNAARAVLASFGYGGKAQAALQYLDKLEQHDPVMYAIVRQSVDSAQAVAKPFKELTYEEVQGLKAEIDSLWHLAKRSKQMEVDGNLLDREDIAAQLNDRMVEIGIPEHVPGESSAVTDKEKRINDIRSLGAALRRVESWAELKDGSSLGVFKRFVFLPVKEAADKYRSNKIVALRNYRALFDAIAPTMKREVIAAPELGYTFGKESGGVAMNEILHAILHTGNASNKRKLLLGRGWGSVMENGEVDTRKWDSFIARMVREGKLTKAHMDFAQGVWDTMESLKPDAQRAHRDAYGKYFDEVTADSFQTPWGFYRGGYVPAMVDIQQVKDQELKRLVEEGKEGMQFSFPGTSKGFTKSRVEYNRPLLLDLRTIPQHIDKVLLFSHMENPVRDVAKLIGMKEVSEPLYRMDPTAINAMLMPWLNRAARQQVTTPVSGAGGIMRVANALRNRTSMATMMANVSNTAQQITGFWMAGVKVKPKYLAAAMADYVKSPKKMTEAVVALSPYMENRMSNEVSAMMGEMDAILMDPNLYEKAVDWTKRHTYFMQSAVDNVMGPIIWHGAFNEALEAGHNDADAARIADSAVRTTQGSTLPEDVSRAETGNAMMRLFTQFYGYFNMQANLLGTEFGKVAQETGLRKGMGRGFYITLMAFYVPAMLAEAIAQMFRGGPGDDDKDGEYLDDWLMAVFVYGPARNLTAFVPFIGSAINSAVARFNGNPADDKMSVSPVIGAIEGAGAVPYHLYKAAIGEGIARQAVKDLATMISITTGLPANVAARPLAWLAGVEQDKIEPTGPVDTVRGLVTGVASPESKQ